MCDEIGLSLPPQGHYVLPETRMHFWLFTARKNLGFSTFRKIDLNWFIPAFVKSNVGSSLGATDELRINLCPFFSKKFMKDFLISEDFI